MSPVYKAASSSANAMQGCDIPDVEEVYSGDARIHCLYGSIARGSRQSNTRFPCNCITAILFVEKSVLQTKVARKLCQ